MSGGNPFVTLLRNLMRYQTAATGDHAALLDEVVEQFAYEIEGGTDQSLFFSAHHFDAADDGFALNALNRVMGNARAVDRAVTAAALRTTVSLASSRTSPFTSAVDPKVEFDALYFGGALIERTLRNGFRHDAPKTLLGELRRRHTGGTYDLADLLAVAAATGAPLDSVIGEWWSAAELPGFSNSKLSAYRLPDDERGVPRYQLTVHVRNNERPPGLVRLDSFMAGRLVPGPDVKVPGETALELGMVVSAPPRNVAIDPHWSRNGVTIALAVPEVDTDNVVDAVPLVGSRVSTWRPQELHGVVIDDLDAGFSLAEVGAGSSDMAGKLLNLRPETRRSSWSRDVTLFSWGKYLRTVVRLPPGAGDLVARFETELPSTGRWRLDYHLPGSRVAEMATSVAKPGLAYTRGYQAFGELDITLWVGEGATRIEFDASFATPGWNHLGDFDIGAGDVALTVSNKTSGEVVVADAVRWRRVP